MPGRRGGTSFQLSGSIYEKMEIGCVRCRNRRRAAPGFIAQVYYGDCAGGIMSLSPPVQSYNRFALRA
jgi:hypothetical protein